MNAAERLEGKVAVVVGAGSAVPGWSNGKACAVAYARHGARVLCADFDIARAEATVDFIRAEGGSALAARADATEERDVQSVVDTALRHYGRVDVMHNNVGVGHTIGTPDQIDPDSWDREVAQNLTTAYLGIRCAVPAMKRQGGGAIINTSSLLALRFLRRPSVAYSASKAAVEALTRACAASYGSDNIRVNCIRIGFSETAFLLDTLERRHLSEEDKAVEMAKSRRKVPLRQEHTDPFDVAATAVFLASDDAKHITGAILSVDGGLECAPI